MPHDLCCYQTSASTMPACKWASSVCMRCVCCKQHARSPLQGGLSSVASSMDETDAGRVVRASSLCSEGVRNKPITSSESGRRPHAIAAEFVVRTPWGTPFHSTCIKFTPICSPQALHTKSNGILSEPDPSEQKRHHGYSDTHVESSTIGACSVAAQNSSRGPSDFVLLR